MWAQLMPVCMSSKFRRSIVPIFKTKKMKVGTFQYIYGALNSNKNGNASKLTLLMEN